MNFHLVVDHHKVANVKNMRREDEDELDMNSEQ